MLFRKTLFGSSNCLMYEVWKCLKDLNQHHLFGAALKGLLLYMPIAANSIKLFQFNQFPFPVTRTSPKDRSFKHFFTWGQLSAPEAIAASASLSTFFQSPTLRASVHLLRRFSITCNFCSSTGSVWCPGIQRCLLAFSTCPKLRPLQELDCLLHNAG